MSNVAINIAAEFTGKAAFNNAGKASNGLEKSVKKLAKTLGLAFSTAAVVNFGKASVKAFVQDQKEATRLAGVIKNLGLELSNPAIENYISSLSKASGVTDSELRPAFQALLTTTGSVTKSQKALQQAIDVAAGSGIDLTTVSQDLANAYVGNTKGLKKYNLGLTQAQLKTASFEDITKKLNEQFQGANAAYLSTYAGKMQALTTAAGEAQEKIGGALVDSLMSLSGSTSIDQLITKIDILSDKTVNFIDQFTLGLLEIKALASFGNKGFLGGLFGGNKDVQKQIQAAQVDAYNKKLRRSYMDVWANVKTPAQLAAEKAAAAAAKKREQDLIKTTKANTAELKKQAALKKASTVFDMEQIQIMAAMKQNISDSDRKRLEAQAAILNGNAELASQLTKDILMAQDRTGGLYQYFLSIGDAKIKNPFAFLDDWITKFQEKLNSLKMPNLAPATASAVNNVSVSGVPSGQPWSPGYSMGGNNTPGASFPDTNFGTIPTGNFTYGAGNPMRTDVYIPPIELRITGEGDLTDAIAKNLQNKSLSNGKIADLERRTGFFL